MTVLVLGATGSVGWQVVDAFLDAGERVHGVARHAVDGWNPELGFTSLDITRSAAGELREIMEEAGCTAVVNAAGAWGDTFEEMRDSHIYLAQQLVSELQGLSEPVRLIHYGSVHEYGEAIAEIPFVESQEPQPVSEYAQVKAQVSRSLLAQPGLDTVVLRCGNMCGPYPPAESFLAALMLRVDDARQAGSVLEIAVADSARDYIDVRDAARAAVHAANAATPPGVVNVGWGRATKIQELVEDLVAAAGLPPDQVRLVQQEVASKGGVWTCLDVRTAREALGWEPAIDLSTSIADMWQAHAASTTDSSGH